MNKDYTVKPLDFDDQSLRIYSEFLAKYFKRPDLFTFEYLKWQYVENPVGRAVGYNAFFKDELVSHAAAIPLTAFIFDKEEKWLLSVNFLTSPAHYRKGLSALLAKKMDNLGKNLGCTFDIGIANRKSTPYSIKARGMEWAATLDVRLGVGLPKRKKEPAVHYDFKVLWDKESLAWRLRRPGSQYWKKTKGELDLVFTCSGKPGSKTLLGHFASEEIGEALPIKSKINMPLTLWVGKDPHIDWHRTLSFNLPGWLRASPLNLLYKDLSGKNRSLINKRIFFQAIDFDAF